MRAFFLVCCCLLPLTVWAYPDEVACEGTGPGVARALLNIERRFGPLSEATVQTWETLQDDPEEETFRLHSFQVMAGRPSWVGQEGFRLEVNLAPDTVPRYGRRYRSSLRYDDLATPWRLNCTFPNARP